jgi:hypothetical protein
LLLKLPSRFFNSDGEIYYRSNIGTMLILACGPGQTMMSATF